MNASSPEPRPRRLADLAAGTIVSDRDTTIDLATLAHGTTLGGAAPLLAGKSILISVASQPPAVAAAVELDGLAHRFVLAPPDLAADHVRAVIADAGINFIVTDRPQLFAGSGCSLVPLTLPVADASPVERNFDTQWTLLTSGTSGRPKLAAHTRAALTGAIPPRPCKGARAVWATFYDIRRYGGLQILLRAIIGGAAMALTSPGESLRDHLHRLGALGVTAMSGTPSHWRRVLMTPDRGGFAPAYIRLSGEIADQMILDALHLAFPQAKIGHAYASTEAGVAFAVDDGREGFPAALVERPANGVEMRIANGALQIRSLRAASFYVAPDAPPLAGPDGYIDTGDLVERRGDRYAFVGRRGGIVNVGGLKVNPEEVEAIINQHPLVRMALVRGRRNPVTGALVVADVVLRDGVAGDEALSREITEMCLNALAPHKAPAIVRFVPNLPLTPAGKLSRDPAQTSKSPPDA